jgi:hypothetical protein
MVQIVRFNVHVQFSVIDFILVVAVDRIVEIPGSIQGIFGTMSLGKFKERSRKKQNF